MSNATAYRPVAAYRIASPPLGCTILNKRLPLPYRRLAPDKTDATNNNPDWGETGQLVLLPGVATEADNTFHQIGGVVAIQHPLIKNRPMSIRCSPPPLWAMHRVTDATLLNDTDVNLLEYDATKSSYTAATFTSTVYPSSVSGPRSHPYYIQRDLDSSATASLADGTFTLGTGVWLISVRLASPTAAGIASAATVQRIRVYNGSTYLISWDHEASTSADLPDLFYHNGVVTVTSGTTTISILITASNYSSNADIVADVSAHKLSSIASTPVDDSPTETS